VIEQPDLELYLLRHAHAGNAAEWTGNDDLRPLSSRGRQQARDLGRHLAARAFALDLLVSSPKLRARQTAELVGEEIGAAVGLDERLGGPLDVDDLSVVLDDLGGQRVMLVGHDPDFSELAAQLSGTLRLPLRKGALARIDVSLPLHPGAGILRWLLPPEVYREL
jgi:phosphohistidine phosphatase